ncbi:Hsp70 family protein [Rhodococcus sp. UNC363MFTsu5.1]|uniref:Hsp70 family protein n=1 Tax=Rhodococcus sp. UNC363MFTsu5.1 TaxID=1449069 RepID=UPI0012DEA460|nr:Hsp70 family protein [Rhodococcus sp. UNC363MFTsu5.1]
MSAVLGVSVGSSAVRMARPDVASRRGPGGVEAFQRQVIATVPHRAEETAAQSIGVLLAQGGETVGATGVAYATQRQADALQQAMARQRLHNYQLIPASTAAIARLEATGEIYDFGTLVLYDLGSSGLTVSVIDRASGTVLAADRSTEIAGDYFDWLISQHQATAQGIVSPVGADEATAFNERCRFAKEQLSASEAIAVPSEAGLILLSRETFESMIVVPVEGSARFARGVIAASGRYPDAVVLLGGGAHIPLVQSILRNWLNLPTVVPAEPEMVAAQGAAMLATPVAPPVEPPEPQWGAADALSPRRTRGPSRRQLAIAGAAATGLVVVAGIGLSMGRDGAATTQGEGRATAVTEDQDAPSTTTAPPTTTTTPPSSTPRAPAPQPAAEPSQATPEPPPVPGPPPRRYLNLPDPIQIEVPPGMELPPGMVR